jgi:hypothetical protein
VCVAGYGERSDARTNIRNRYRHRDSTLAPAPFGSAAPKILCFFPRTRPHPQRTPTPLAPTESGLTRRT